MKKLLKYGWRVGLKCYLLQLLQGSRKLVYRLRSENSPRLMQDRLKQLALFSGQGEIYIGKSTIGI